MQKLSFILVMILSLQSFAGSVYDLKVNAKPLFKVFVDQGVPAAALKRTFDFIDANAGKKVKVAAKDRSNQTKMSSKEITVRTDTIAIIDYTLPSDQNRLYVLHLKNGIVTKHHVAHGKGSGVRYATKFSNVDKTKMTSLGLYLAGSVYSGGHGASLNLHGVDKTNDQASARDIVMHGAPYVSDDFLKRTGRLGRSWGCPAISPILMKKMIGFLKDGGIVYAYHKDMNEMIAKGKNIQVVTTVQDDVDQDLDGEEETVRAKASSIKRK
ncbi:hypothetical protein CIK05_05630 [Bdellovibrio sp. qaytius]|nr:hypothetical protein CIK05_05630 [Bdellovibrio sp. qaytius]